MAPAVYDQTQVEIEGGGLHLPRQRLGPRLRRLLRGVAARRGQRTTPELPELAAGRGARLPRHQARAALQPAAAALHGGDADQGARAARHRPAVDLRADRRDDHQGPRLRRDQGAAAAPDADRRGRQRDHGRPLQGHLRRRLHGRRWRSDSTRSRAGTQEWVPVVSDFYGPLQKMLSAAEEAMPADTDEVCPECHEGHLVHKASRFGPFMGCSRYPKCKFRRALTANGEAAAAEAARGAVPRVRPAAAAAHRPLRRVRRLLRLPGVQVHQARRGRRRPSRPARSARSAGRGSWSSARAGTVRSSRARATPTASTAPTSARTARREKGPKVLDEPCPICGKPLVERRGRYGMFKSCSDYPACPGPKGVKKVEV